MLCMASPHRYKGAAKTANDRTKSFKREEEVENVQVCVHLKWGVLFAARQLRRLCTLEKVEDTSIPSCRRFRPSLARLSHFSHFTISRGDHQTEHSLKQQSLAFMSIQSELDLDCFCSVELWKLKCGKLPLIRRAGLSDSKSLTPVAKAFPLH